MAGPWDKYSQPSAPAAGPWAKYAAPAAPPEPNRFATPNPTGPTVGPIVPTVAHGEGPTTGPQTAASRALTEAKDWGDVALDTGASLARGVRRGVANIAGLPVEALNASPLIVNALPGTQGAKPLSDDPRGGAKDMDWLLRAGGLIPDYEPETGAGRFANRIGEEVGATAVPLAGLGMKAAQVGVQGAREMGPVARAFVEPMAVAPGRVAGREMGYAAAAGTGAQTANEIVDIDNHKGTWWSDLLGSIGGMTGLGVGKAVTGLGRNVVGTVTGKTGAFDDVAGREVVNRIIDNSTQMQQQAAAVGPRNIDAEGLARTLSAPSAAEQVIPGFRANIADRAVDPGLSTLTYNADAALPGAGNARRVANAAAVDDRISGLAPQGNPAEFRQALGFGAQSRIDDAVGARDAAQLSYGDALADVTPMTSDVQRGTMLRSSLSDRAAAEKQAIADLYGQVDETVPIDAAGLAERVQGVTDSLPLNDRLRFSPSETSAAAQLGEAGTVPVSEAMSIRSGLSSDMRAPSATDQGKRVTGKYLDEVDDFIRGALPEDQAALMQQGKDARLSYGKRFEDRGAVPEILRETGRGQYRMADEAVTPRALAGETDYKAVMAEAGEAPAARQAVREQIAADAERAKALRSPEALTRFMADRNFVLDDFPQLRADLQRAGASKQTLDAAENAAKQAEKAYSPGGNSPAGQYLKYDDTQTRAAVGTAWKSARPEEAMRELLDVAGDTAQTRAAAKAALWEEVSGTGKLDAPTMTSADGVQRWSGRKLDKLFQDPRFAKTAEVLWEDNPAHLADMREVVAALGKADASMNAKAPATSGTGQSLSGKYDPSMSTASIASRARSVNRGQLSPTIAVVDLLSTFLRNKSAKVQARAIDDLMTNAINDPELAAALLRRYNPADEAAETRAFLTKYGVRIPTVANILGGVDDEDDEDIKRAVTK